MAFCSNCGHQLADGAKFCFECGAKVNASESQGTQRKTVYDGEIHKCPNCGEKLGSFALVCSSCGYELRGICSVKTAKELAERLELLENNRELESENSFFHSIIYGEKPSKTAQLKAELISNFNIPNDKENIIEFLILASSNISCESNFQDKSEVIMKKAWSSKFLQAYEKLQVLAIGQTSLEPLLEKYAPRYKNAVKGLYNGSTRVDDVRMMLLATLIIMITLLFVFALTGLL